MAHRLLHGFPGSGIVVAFGLDFARCPPLGPLSLRAGDRFPVKIRYRIVRTWEGPLRGLAPEGVVRFRCAGDVGLPVGLRRSVPLEKKMSLPGFPGSDMAL